MTKTDLRMDGRVVLALGESTGHMHQVMDLVTEAPPALEACQFFEVDGRRELVVLEPCVLTHQEHDAMRLYPDGRAEKVSNRTGAVLARADYPAQIRQGDVFLQPLGPGVWRHIQQIEMPRPDAWRAVVD